MALTPATRPSRLERLLGQDALALVTYSGPFGFEPTTYGLDHTAATIIRRGRQNATAKPEVTTLDTTLVARTLAPTPVGTIARLYLTDVALFHLGYLSPSSPEAWAARWRFSGHITDAAQTLDAHTRAAIRRITAAGVRARLARARIGRTPWPPGTTDRDIVIDALALAGGQDYRAVLTSPIDTYWLSGPAQARPAGMDRFVPWDIDRRSAMDVIDELADSTGGVLVETGTGQFDWITPEHRRGAPVALDLDASVLITPIPLEETQADLATAARVRYGPEDDETVSTVTDTRAADYHGHNEVTRATRLAHHDDADALARDIVGRGGWPTWTLPRATVDLLTLVEDGRLDLARAILALRGGELVRIVGLPSHSPVAGGPMWVEGITERITADRWLVDLALVDYAQLAPARRWLDITEEPRVLRTNLISNPSLEAGGTGWGANSGGGAGASTVEQPGGYVGPAFRRFTWTQPSTSSAATGGLAFGPGIPATSGQPISAAGGVRVNRAAQRIAIRVFWYNAEGANLGISDGPSATFSPGIWQLLKADGLVAPPGTASCLVAFYRTTIADGGRQWIAGDTIDVDGAIAEHAALVGVYFDGSTNPPTGRANRWTGPAHLSPSEQTDLHGTWGDTPGDVTWLRATTWQPPDIDADTWRGTPSDTRWPDLPAAAWATY